MNIDKLKKAEQKFLSLYPDGFFDPTMQEIAKKHKMDQRTKQAQDFFKKSAFGDVNTICENMVKIISQSSLISIFEKPKFRDVVRSMGPSEEKALAQSLKLMLHGDQQKGFEQIVEILGQYKLAKWSLVTVIPNYYKPDEEVFVKPTTTKGIISTFELDGVVYNPKPTWDFYKKYRSQILEMKSQVDETLAINNAAFCGFLMMSM